MRKFLAILMAALLLAGLVGALAEAASDEEIYNVTGDWFVDYFTIPMIFTFNEDGTFIGTIDMDIPLADDGSNSITGIWEFDGETLTISDPETTDESFSFTWDGEKLSGPIIVDGVEGFLEFYRVEATEEETAE